MNMIKITLKGLSTAVLIALAPALPANATADGPDYFRVVGLDGGSTLAMKSRPSGNSRAIARIPFNARRLANTGRFRRGWTKVRYDGQTGWVRARSISEDSGGPLFYRAQLGRYGTLDVHRRPWKGSRVRGQIPNGAKTIRDLGRCQGGWCKVAYRGLRGWVQAHCLIVRRDPNRVIYRADLDRTADRIYPRRKWWQRGASFYRDGRYGLGRLRRSRRSPSLYRDSGYRW